MLVRIIQSTFGEPSRLYIRLRESTQSLSFSDQVGVVDS